MAKVWVIRTDDPEADIGADARAVLGATTGWLTAADLAKLGPVCIDIPQHGSKAPVEIVENWLDGHLAGWRLELSVLNG